MFHEYIDNDQHPTQCRHGPLLERSCTNPVCCAIYILLLAAVIFLGIFSSNATMISQSELSAELNDSQFGHPLLAIIKATLEINLSLTIAAVLSFILTITTFIIPALAAFILIPLFLILMLLLGAVFLYRYFGKNLPFISVETQQSVVESHSYVALGVGIMFTLGFIVAIATICSKRSKFKFTYPILQIAKICFWENCYMIIISVGLMILTLISIGFNILLLAMSQDKKHSQQYIDSRIMGAIIIFEFFWTHGFILALSDFIFQSIAIHWYFNGQKLGEGYSKCGNNCSPTFSMLFRHIGTISFGWIIGYVPESISSQLKCKCVTKYCYNETVLQGLPFCMANAKMFQLRNSTKAFLPNLYMMGNFYMSLAKIFVIMFSLVICYVLLVQKNAEIFQNIPNLIAPLFVILFASDEIATHFLNSTGLIADTIVFMYNVDAGIQRKDYGKMQPQSCPQDVYEIIQSNSTGAEDTEF